MYFLIDNSLSVLLKLSFPKVYVKLKQIEQSQLS